MSTTKVLHRSFAAGEIAEELYGRLDLTKNQTGLAICRNCETLPHGPARNRAGFGYILETKDSTKKSVVRPFSFNTEQTYILEIGDEYIRFHLNGGTLLETGLVVTGITNAEPGVVTYTGTDPANGDWFFVADVAGMTEINGRYVKVANVNAGANTFEMVSIHDGSDVDTTDFGVYTSGGTISRVYEIASPYLEEHLFDLHYTQSNDVLTIVHPSYEPRELRRAGATNWTLDVIDFEPAVATPTVPTVGAGGPGGGTPIDWSYVVTAVSLETGEESLASPEDTVNVDLTVAGNYVNVTPPAISGVRFNVYKLDGGLYGYIGQTPGSSFIDRNITADVSRTPPTLNNPFDGADDYPGAVGYYEQRRCFAGTTNQPQGFFATRSATERNFSQSIPLRDDDAIIMRIAGREANSIRHIVSLEPLFLLTSGGEWRVSPATSDFLTPENAKAKQFAFEGANNVQPVLAASAVIYSPDCDSRFRELKYVRDENGASTIGVSDISVMAPHLFEGYTITDLTYSKAPYRMVWGVRTTGASDNGSLVSVTYLPEQQVIAHHRHDTVSLFDDDGDTTEITGVFESVACVKEGAEFPVYAVVKRSINGVERRYIERLHKRSFATISDAFHVDCGVSYSGEAVDTISNLWHLEGCPVVGLFDGNPVVRGLTVENGQITLPFEFTKAHVGFPVTSDIQTLPVAFEAVAGGQGILKNVNAVYLRLKQSSGLKIGVNFDEMVEFTTRSSEPYNSPPELFSGVREVTIMPEWSDDASICLRQTNPLPFTVTALTLDVALEV